MTAITQLRPGGVPGAVYAITDKGVILTGTRDDTAITKLSAAGPFPWYEIDDKGQAEPPPTNTRDDTRITSLRPGGVPGGYYDILAKDEALTDSLWAHDTYTVFLRIGDIDVIEYAITETYRPVLTQTAAVTVLVGPTDTYTPVMQLSGVVVSKGNISRSVTDTYTPVMTLGAGFVVSMTASDTYTPVLDLAANVWGDNVVAVTDTYTPVMGFAFSLEPLTYLTMNADDTYAPVVTLSGSVSENIYGDVDRIVITSRPFGHIRIKPV